MLSPALFALSGTVESARLGGHRGKHRLEALSWLISGN
jgi:hypothetical protein